MVGEKKEESSRKRGREGEIERDDLSGILVKKSPLQKLSYRIFSVYSFRGKDSGN